jgi:hypothetical protein
VAWTWLNDITVGDSPDHPELKMFDRAESGTYEGTGYCEDIGYGSADIGYDTVRIRKNSNGVQGQAFLLMLESGGRDAVKTDGVVVRYR